MGPGGPTLALVPGPVLLAASGRAQVQWGPRGTAGLLSGWHLFCVAHASAHQVLNNLTPIPKPRLFLRRAQPWTGLRGQPQPQ